MVQGETVAVAVPIEAGSRMILMVNLSEHLPSAQKVEEKYLVILLDQWHKGLMTQSSVRRCQHYPYMIRRIILCDAVRVALIHRAPWHLHRENALLVCLCRSPIPIDVHLLSVADSNYAKLFPPEFIPMWCSSSISILFLWLSLKLNDAEGSAMEVKQ